MRVIDTSAWIEWAMDSSLAERILPELPDPDDWIVPTVIQLELAKWFTRVVGPNEAEDVIGVTEQFRVVDLDTDIALAAADCCVRLGLSTADAVIYATARQLGADLVTCDAHFSGLPGVIFIAKS